MIAHAFAGLTPAPGRDHAQWIVDAMRDREGVAHVVPDRFDACARVHHPLPDGRRWADVAPAYLREGTTSYEFPFPREVDAVRGNLGSDAVDRLVQVFRHRTDTPRDCHFGLWNGWGELHPGSHTSVYVRQTNSPLRRYWRKLRARRLQTAEYRKARVVYSFVDACPVEPWWGARNMLLFDGPIEAVASIGGVYLVSDELRRRGPQWWWPHDKAWFIATEIDYPWTYVGASGDAIAELRATGLEVVDVGFDDQW